MKWLHPLGNTLETWKLLRTGRALTLRGWVLLLAVCGALASGLIGTVYPFLAVTAPVEANMLVVEGWAPDFSMRAAIDEFRRRSYRELIATGGPLEKGEPLSQYGDYAQIGRLTLERLGAPTGALHAVPAPKVKRDRTFSSAVALRKWLLQRGSLPEAINVITTDAHARRTRLLFEKAFSGKTKIGIIAVPDERFDGSRWWRSSAGVRTVADELIAYLYSRFFFVVADDLKEP